MPAWRDLEALKGSIVLSEQRLEVSEFGHLMMGNDGQ